MSSRETMLGRIRAALADVPAEERPEDVPVPRDYRRSHAGADVVGRFAERVADYQATVRLVAEPELAAALGAALTERGARQVVVPEGFRAEWLPAGPFTVLSDDPQLTTGQLDATDAVLSTAALGIAETGTLVLDGGPGQGRRALTLLPDYHLCVLRADQVVGDLPEALERLDPRRPLTFISGPSATSDIELDRVEGVHGPRTLDVVVVTEPGRSKEE
ncbi:L-lactate dehydrogenase complex protein LldG [Kitasatospora sp. GAS204A]|uniref:LutC/YkgG family protein n=1 Tax=unclassified Kitasatospora TaxID=2633591 RepID=UPI00247426EC|nr:LUD domain-containing protein [Kitasatospora sp. GAS204B]MDH6121077.1 L-lactate dehydrogenase complex protein LldG [Kitasatospora sp. GAS204B]